MESENWSFFIVQAKRGRGWTEIGHIAFGTMGNFLKCSDTDGILFWSRAFQKSQKPRFMMDGSLENILKTRNSLCVLFS